MKKKKPERTKSDELSNTQTDGSESADAGEIGASMKNKGNKSKDLTQQSNTIMQ